MKKIITAINNPKLNEELKKEKNFEIIGKDVQYKEAILEILEKNNDIDLIIINEKIPGEIKLENLIKKIKIINETIKMIFILEKENEDTEKILIKNNIVDIYYNNKINLKELIKIINKQEVNMEEEIIKLKKIIEEKKEIRKINLKNEIINKIKSKIINHKKTKENKEKITSNKIITFSGNYKSGKSVLSLMISQALADHNYKVLLIDADLEKQDLSIILKKRKNRNYHLEKRKNIIKLKDNNLYHKVKLSNKKKIIYYYKIKKYINLFTNKINKNLYFFYGLNNILEKEKTEKCINLFLKNIKLKYDFIIIEVSKSNLEIINKEILKNSNMNFIVMEPNLLGIEEIKKLLDKYLKKWKVIKNTISIISNKKNLNSINKEIISKSLSFKNIIHEIKENKIYQILISKYFKRKIIINKKTTKKEINKIMNQIIFNKF